VVFAGFGIGVVASLVFADPRIAVASGVAFLTAQLVDVSIFNKLRNKDWWIAPFTSSVLSNILDTWLFFFLAFVATGASWYGWAVGDLMVKWAVSLLALLPYGIIVLKNRANPASA